MQEKENNKPITSDIREQKGADKDITQSLMEKLESFITFEPFIIYESIVCTPFPDTNRINSSCMGVHFTPDDEVYLHVYSGTDTRKLLIEGAMFSINFSENFYDYARAAILGYKMGPDEIEIPEEEFEFVGPDSSIPALKNSWLTISCKVIPAPKELLKGIPCRRRETPNVRAKIIEKRINRLPKIFNNRSMNLAIEALILATRIPEQDFYSKEYNKMLEYYRWYKRQIIQWHDMDRFEEGFEIIENYLIDKGVKPYDLFDLDHI